MAQTITTKRHGHHAPDAESEATFTLEPDAASELHRRVNELKEGRVAVVPASKVRAELHRRRSV